MRIYIAGAMTGIADWNFPAFDAAAAAWRAAGWDVENPAEHFDRDTTLPYSTYVESDIKCLAACDAVALLPGWDGPTARGSVWEAEQDTWLTPLKRSINAIAAGMRNTG